jgi:hypothetical protein
MIRFAKYPIPRISLPEPYSPALGSKSILLSTLTLPVAQGLQAGKSTLNRQWVVEALLSQVKQMVLQNGRSYPPSTLIQILSQYCTHLAMMLSQVDIIFIELE